MARPRTPSKILELRGSFRTHPERRREDAAGSAPFDRTPPENLSEPEKAAWCKLIERLPLVTLYNTDELAVAQLARILTALEALDPSCPEFVRLDAAFRAWAIQCGLSPLARAHLPQADTRTSNAFAEFRNPT